MNYNLPPANLLQLTTLENTSANQPECDKRAVYRQNYRTQAELTMNSDRVNHDLN
jgi:hypothetical protein